MLAAALLSACGYVGPPMPPTLEIPLAVTDFRAWESGDNIEFQFTLPDKTTENLPLTEVRSIELRIGEDPSQSKPIQLKVSKPGPVTDQVTAQTWIGKTVVLAVRAIGPKDMQFRIWHIGRDKERKALRVIVMQMTEQ